MAKKTVVKKRSILHPEKGRRLLIDRDTLEKIGRDAEAWEALQKYGATYALKILVYKAVGLAPPETPTAAMSRGGKGSKRGVRRKEAFNNLFEEFESELEKVSVKKKKKG